MDEPVRIEESSKTRSRLSMELCAIETTCSHRKNHIDVSKGFLQDLPNQNPNHQNLGKLQYISLYPESRAAIFKEMIPLCLNHHLWVSVAT